MTSVLFHTVFVCVQDPPESVWTSLKGNSWSLTPSTSAWLSHVSLLHFHSHWGQVKSNASQASFSRFNLSSKPSALSLSFCFSAFLSVCLSYVWMYVFYIMSPASLLPDHCFTSAIYWQRAFKKKGAEGGGWRHRLPPHAALSPAYKKNGGNNIFYIYTFNSLKRDVFTFQWHKASQGMRLSHPNDNFYNSLYFYIKF